MIFTQIECYAQSFDIILIQNFFTGYFRHEANTERTINIMRNAEMWNETVREHLHLWPNCH